MHGSAGATGAALPRRAAREVGRGFSDFRRIRELIIVRVGSRYIISVMFRTFFVFPLDRAVMRRSRCYEVRVRLAAYGSVEQDIAIVVFESIGGSAIVT